MSRYRFIAAEQSGRRSVVKACGLLKVSRSAYHQWTGRKPSEREQRDAELSKLIAGIHGESRGTYGAPRVHEQLKREGVACSRKRVARLMAQRGLVGRQKRRKVATTVADKDAEPTATDLVGRAFGPAEIAPNRIWVGDITYIRTWEGWLYLATVIDLASRRVVGFAMAEHMRASLVCQALEMALTSRRPGPGVIFHSDRGSQYTSRAFAAVLAAGGVVASLSRPGQCWDNAVAESFFATLKLELIHRASWTTRAAARSAIFEYIEVFYNRRRLHSALGYCAPAEYEAAGRPGANTVVPGAPGEREHEAPCLSGRGAAVAAGGSISVDNQAPSAAALARKPGASVLSLTSVNPGGTANVYSINSSSQGERRALHP